MTDFSFKMTIFFLLLGPVKIIPAFARLTRGADSGYKRTAAVWAAVFATVICAIVVLQARSFASQYQLSVPALELSGGIILLLSALALIFPRPEPDVAAVDRPSAVRLGLSPLATPIVVTPAGVAAIMVFVLLAAGNPAALRSIGTAIAIVMVLNFLVMFFIDLVLKLPGLMLVLQMLGSILAVVQVALAVQEFINAFARLGLVDKV